MCTINNTRGRLFGPDGCQVPIGNGVCGETKTLDIINEFKRLYEEKMQEIDTAGGGDCLQEKLRLQQEWIGNLTEQNELLVRAVEELEHEATERVHILEEKLKHSAQCICEEETKRKDRESTIQELQGKIAYFNSFGDVEALATELKCRNEECTTLKQAMVDMRQALTEEVASKHDIILKLKKDGQDLEERCIQADKQTAFRDDIIKELRKEIKQLKQQVFLPEKPFKTNPIPEQFLRRNSDGESYLVINHTRKIVQSGKSTVIYLRHGSNDNCKETPESLKNAVEEHTNSCSKCRLKFQNSKEKTKLNANHLEDNEKTLHHCKSENNLFDFKKNLKPVKERSKWTAGTMNRCNTFVGSTTEVLRNVDFETRLKHRKVSVPNHMPVKMYINNIELNKK